MGFSSVASAYSVVSSLDKETSGSKTPKTYCEKDELLFSISDHGNVLIVFGKNGRFPVLKSKVRQMSIDSPEKLINAIKTVDLKMSHVFPIEFVLGITENKTWEQEFIEKVKKSDIRPSLRNEILQRYQNETKETRR